jgi:hypothetical protein
LCVLFAYIVNQCYHLNMKCLPQPYVLNIWCPNDGIILGGGGNIERQGPAE